MSQKNKLYPINLKIVDQDDGRRHSEAQAEISSKFVEM